MVVGLGRGQPSWVVTTDGDRLFFWEERMMKCSGIRQMVAQLLECTTNQDSELFTLQGELCSMSYNSNLS